MDAFTGSGLKRKFDDVDVGSSVSNSDDEISSSDSADSCDSLNPPTTASFTREWAAPSPPTLTHTHSLPPYPPNPSPPPHPTPHRASEPIAALLTASSIQLGDLTLIVIFPPLGSPLLCGGPHCSNSIELSLIYSSWLFTCAMVCELVDNWGNSRFLNSYGSIGFLERTSDTIDQGFPVGQIWLTACFCK